MASAFEISPPALSNTLHQFINARLPNSSETVTNWGPGIHIYEPMGTIFAQTSIEGS